MTDDGRYFLAVWPDAGVRDRLVEWMAEMSVAAPVRPVPGANLHITLAFLGQLDTPRLAAVREAAAGLRWRPARLVLNRIGFWQRNRIIWAGSREGSETLSMLADALRRELRRRGFDADKRAFVPHVTLYRKARRRPRWRRRDIEWRIDELCLVESRLTEEGARYEVIDRWSAHGDME